MLDAVGNVVTVHNEALSLLHGVCSHLDHCFKVAHFVFLMLCELTVDRGLPIQRIRRMTSALPQSLDALQKSILVCRCSN